MITAATILLIFNAVFFITMVFQPPYAAVDIVFSSLGVWNLIAAIALVVSA